MTGMTGTFTHMAPEVFFATEGYSEKADIFSSAVCMVHLISGEQAYTATDAQWRPEILARRVALEGYRAPLERKIKHKDMRDLVTRMWAHDPLKRPSSSECAAELEAMLDTVTSWSLKPLALLKRTFSPASSNGDHHGAHQRRFSGSFRSLERAGSFLGHAASFSLGRTPFRETSQSIGRTPDTSQSLH